MLLVADSVGTLKTARGWYVPLWILSALWRSLVCRLQGRPAVPLPVCGARPSDRQDARDTDRIIRVVDCVQRVMVPRTRHRCFYRSYTRAVVLRKLGVPAILNFGLRNLGAQATARTTGHCWVTIDDCPLLERDPCETYPVLLSEPPEGCRHWPGGD